MLSFQGCNLGTVLELHSTITKFPPDLCQPKLFHTSTMKTLKVFSKDLSHKKCKTGKPKKMVYQPLASLDRALLNPFISTGGTLGGVGWLAIIKQHQSKTSLASTDLPCRFFTAINLGSMLTLPSTPEKITTRTCLGNFLVGGFNPFEKY